MKKFLSIILVALLLVTAIVPAFADGEDVVERLNNGEVHVRAKWDSYNYVGFSMVEALNAGGYYKGEDGTGVQGTEPLTRWQFCLIMLRAMTGDLVDANWVTYLQEYGEEDIVYDDVRRILNMTYEEQQADPELFNFYKSSLGAILFMMHNKYIIGSADANGEINLRPNDTISFTEAVTIVVRMLGWNSTAMNYNYPQNYLDVADEIGVFGHYEENGGDPVWVGLAMDKIGLDDVVTYEIAAQLVFALWTCDVYDNEIGEIVDNPYAEQLAELEAEIAEQLQLQISSFEMGAIVGDGYMIYREGAGKDNLDDPQNQYTILSVKDNYALPGAGVVSVKNGTTVGEIMSEFISNTPGDKLTGWNFGKYNLYKYKGSRLNLSEFGVVDDANMTYETLTTDYPIVNGILGIIDELGGTIIWVDADKHVLDPEDVTEANSEVQFNTNKTQVSFRTEWIRFTDYGVANDDFTYAELSANANAVALMNLINELGGTIVWRNDDREIVEEAAFLAGEAEINTKRTFILLPNGADQDNAEGTRWTITYSDPDAQLDGWDLNRIAKVRMVENGYWAFYELDENGQPIYETKMPALIFGTVDRGSETVDSSIQYVAGLENAWTNYEVNANTTLARESAGQHDKVIFLHNGDEWYTEVVKGGAQLAGNIEAILEAAVGMANLNEALGLNLEAEGACEVLSIYLDQGDARGRELDINLEGYVIEVLANTKNADPEMQWNGEEYAFGSSCSSVKVVNSRVYTKDCLAIFCFDGILADLNEEFGIDYWWDTDEYQGVGLEYDAPCEQIHLENKALETIVWGMDTDANGAIDYIVWGGFQAN